MGESQQQRRSMNGYTVAATGLGDENAHPVDHREPPAQTTRVAGVRTPFDRSSGAEVQATAPGTRRLARLISGSVSHANQTAASQTTLDRLACENSGIAASP
jgi:hypothetical protein